MRTTQLGRAILTGVLLATVVVAGTHTARAQEGYVIYESEWRLPLGRGIATDFQELAAFKITTSPSPSRAVLVRYSFKDAAGRWIELSDELTVNGPGTNGFMAKSAANNQVIITADVPAYIKSVNQRAGSLPREALNALRASVWTGLLNGTVRFNGYEYEMTTDSWTLAPQAMER